MFIWDGVGGGTKKGGELSSMMVYIMRMEASRFQHLSTAPPPTPGSLITLQTKFPTFEFGRTPSNPSKGFATPSAVGVNLSVEEHIV